MMRGGAALALCLPLLAAVVSTPAAATEASAFGIGPQSRALAGAGATQALGAESTFVNPAALAFTTRPTLTAGYGFRRASLAWQASGAAEQHADEDAIALSQLGFTLPLGLFAAPLVLGFTSLSPSGSVARAALPLAEQPQFPRLVSNARAVDFDLGLGLLLGDWLSLGVGLRALSTLSGDTEVVRGRKTTTTRVSDTLEPALAPHAALGLKLGAASDLAAVVRAPLRSDFDMRLGAVDLGTTQLPPLHLAGVAAYDPWSASLELARRFGSLSALVGAEYHRFRDTPALLPATVQCPAERPDCQALRSAAPEFHDTVDVHVAASWRQQLRRSAVAVIRAGYAYLPSPVPEQTGDANLLDNARHRFAFGYGIALDAPLPPVSLDAAVSFDQLTPRTSSKNASVSATNLGAPALESRGDVLTLSLALTVKL